jgi:uncharacterized membrane protein YedE/YeeE
MKTMLVSFASGALFAVGLGVSGMTNPGKVVGFLDLFGAWDPSLMFVMIGAIAVYSVASRVIGRRGAPLFDTRFHLPTRRDMDARLILGAVLFGAGWGLGGYCPGPGLVSAASGALPAIVFVLSMAVGVKLEQFVDGALRRADKRSGALPDSAIAARTLEVRRHDEASPLSP